MAAHTQRRCSWYQVLCAAVHECHTVTQCDVPQGARLLAQGHPTLDTGGGAMILRGAAPTCRASDPEPGAVLKTCVGALVSPQFQKTYDPLRETGASGILSFWAQQACAAGSRKFVCISDKRCLRVPAACHVYSLKGPTAAAVTPSVSAC